MLEGYYIMSTKNDLKEEDLLRLKDRLLADFSSETNLFNFWISNSRATLTKFFKENYNCSYYYIQKLFLNHFNFRKRTKEESTAIQVENSRKTSFERYGSIGFGVKEFNDKAKMTCKNLYGDENFNNRQKYRETCIKEYGVDNYYKSDIGKQHIKQIQTERFGGVGFASKELRSKSIGTMIELYNVDHAAKIPENYEKIYGKEVQKRRTASIHKTFDKKYGCWIAAAPEVVKKRRKRYKYKENSFDSSWELALYIYAVDHNEEITREPIKLECRYDNKVFYYYPDFLYKGQLIEIKGSHLTGIDAWVNPYTKNANIQEKNYQKYLCAVSNGVKIMGYDDIKFALEYIKKTYGKDYLKQFKNVKT